MTFRAVALFLRSLLLLPLIACSEPQIGDQTQPNAAAELVQWYLPKPLREVSGLALLDDQNVLAIQDETAEIFRLNIQTGEVIARHSLGRPAINGDFEGVAVHDGQLYLLTSKGIIYKAAYASSGTAMSSELPYQSFDSGLKKTCELEGLAHQPDSPLLWLLCKSVFAEPKGLRLDLYAWSTATQALVPELSKKIPLEYGQTAHRLNPSGLAFTPDGERLLVIAARQSSYAWLAWSEVPRLLSLSKLPAKGKHRQAEGVGISSQGLLLIADEGKKKRGILSRYAALLP